jgi:hypothetical protein
MSSGEAVTSSIQTRDILHPKIDGQLVLHQEKVVDAT